MIAYAGCQRLLAGERDDLEIRAQPRWSLESLAADLEPISRIFFFSATELRSHFA